jgi:hypothetical protein
LAAVALLGALWGLREPPRGAYAAVAVLTGLAHAAIAVFLGWYGLLAFRSWTY